MREQVSDRKRPGERVTDSFQTGASGFSEAQQTLNGNLNVNFSVIWAVLMHAPQRQIVKLGTMGEYGTPDMDIEEGWIEIEHKGRLPIRARRRSSIITAPYTTLAGSPIP